jgi:hypothetical protein
MASECQHEDFVSVVDVYRLTDSTGRVTAYSAEVNIRCSECGQEFRWLGLSAGSSPTVPMVSIDGTVLRAPITPTTAPTGEEG